MARASAPIVVINASREPVVDAVRRLTHGRGVDLVFECSGAPNAVNEAIQMLKRGGRVCLGAFSQKPALVDVGSIVTNNIYLYGIRGEGQSAVRRAASLIAQKKLDPSPLHTHTFALDQLPTGAALLPGEDRRRHQGRHQAPVARCRLP